MRRRSAPRPRAEAAALPPGPEPVDQVAHELGALGVCPSSGLAHHGFPLLGRDRTHVDGRWVEFAKFQTLTVWHFSALAVGQAADCLATDKFERRGSAMFFSATPGGLP